MNSAPTIRHVAIVSPGEMGHAVGRVLRDHDLEVLTCLEGRSERTRSLSRAAGFREVASLFEVAREADLILSILVPSDAVAAAQLLADAIRSTGASPYVADCNAIAPEAAVAMEEIISDAGARFIDASIIGFPPALGVVPRFYASGPHVGAMSALDGKGLEVVPIGDRVGQASAIKMCYAGLTKGTFALYYAVALAAERMGLFDELCRELMHSQGYAHKQMERYLPRLPAKAHRWIGEMEQIAAALEHAGVTPGFHEAAAAMFRIVSQSTLGKETPETIDEARTLKETIATLAREGLGAIAPDLP